MKPAYIIAISIAELLVTGCAVKESMTMVNPVQGYIDQPNYKGRRKTAMAEMPIYTEEDDLNPTYTQHQIQVSASHV